MKKRFKIENEDGEITDVIRIQGKGKDALIRELSKIIADIEEELDNSKRMVVVNETEEISKIKDSILSSEDNENLSRAINDKIKDMDIGDITKALCAAIQNLINAIDIDIGHTTFIMNLPDGTTRITTDYASFDKLADMLKDIIDGVDEGTNE